MQKMTNTTDLRWKEAEKMMTSRRPQRPPIFSKMRKRKRWHNEEDACHFSSPMKQRRTTSSCTMMITIDKAIATSARRNYAHWEEASGYGGPWELLSMTHRHARSSVCVPAASRDLRTLFFFTGRLKLRERSRCAAALKKSLPCPKGFLVIDLPNRLFSNQPFCGDGDPLISEWGLIIWK